MSNLVLWQEPIIDRTQADVDEVLALKDIGWNRMSAEQKAKWTSGMKGALNESDLNRIENNIHLLSDVLELSLVTHEGSIPYIPNASYWSNLLGNVKAIREAWSRHQSTPEVPTMPVNTYEQINNIEKILLDIYNILMSNFYYESIDEVHMGEEVGLVL